MLRRNELLHDSIADSAGLFATAAMSGEISGGIRELLLSEGMSEEEADALLAHNAEMIHQETVNAVQSMDEQAAAGVTLANKFMEHCDGKLKMRARKNGQQVVVTVCMSELMMSVEDAGIRDIVDVERSIAQD